MDVDVDVPIILLLSGLSCYYSAAVEITTAVAAVSQAAATAAAVMTADASG